MGLFNSISKISNDINKGVSAYKTGSVASITNINPKLDSIITSLSKTKNTVQMIKNTGSNLEDVLSGASAAFSIGGGSDLGRIAESALNGNRITSNFDYDTSVNPDKKIANQDPGKGKLQFPPDLGVYFMEFTFYKYQRPNVLTKSTAKEELKIYLPVPANLMEHFAVKYDEADTGLTGSLANIVDAENKHVNSGTLGSALTANWKSIARIALAKMETNNLLDITEQMNRAIPNPNLSALFSGPTFRPFSFSWRFHPENPEESKTIMKICTEFRKRMLPNLRGNNAFLLGYPNMVGVRLLPAETEQYTVKFKKCVIPSISINYTPHGIPAFFKGTNAPIMIDMSIDLKEIEYFLSEDFGGQSNSTSFDLNSFKSGVLDALLPSSVSGTLGL